MLKVGNLCQYASGCKGLFLKNRRMHVVKQVLSEVSSGQKVSCSSTTATALESSESLRLPVDSDDSETSSNGSPGFISKGLISREHRLAGAPPGPRRPPIGSRVIKFSERDQQRAARSQYHGMCQH